MAEFGNFIIYIIMAGTLIGALASIVKPEGELGREFVNGIHAIGPVFLAQAGIMAAIPIISYLIMYSIGPFFSALGSDASIAALAVIAVDMGGYQLADAIAANRDMWIVAMLVGYTSGASIVYLIPVGLIMLNRDDHKYLALGAMAGLISIPFAVLIAPGDHHLQQPAGQGDHFHHLARRALSAAGLPAGAAAAVAVVCPVFPAGAGPEVAAGGHGEGFLIFGKAADAFIKLVLALCIIEHFTGVFKKVFGGWVFDPLFADKDELFRAIEIAGYIGIMLAGTFPICYLFQRYCRKPMHFIGRKLGLSDTGALALLWCWPISSRFITCSKACGRAIRCCASPSASVRKPHWAITWRLPPTSNLRWCCRS